MSVREQPMRQKMEWGKTLIQMFDELRYGYVQKSKLFSVLPTAFIFLEWPEYPRWVGDRHSSAVLVIQTSSKTILKINLWVGLLYCCFCNFRLHTSDLWNSKEQPTKFYYNLFFLFKGKPDRVMYDFSRTHDFRKKKWWLTSDIYFPWEVIRHFVHAVFVVVFCSFWMSIHLSVFLRKRVSQFSVNNGPVRDLRVFLLGLLKINLYCLCKSVEVIVLLKKCYRRCQWHFNISIKWEKDKAVGRCFPPAWL